MASDTKLSCNGWFMCYLKHDIPDELIKLLVNWYYLKPAQIERFVELHRDIWPFLKNPEFLKKCHIDLLYKDKDSSTFTDYEYSLMYKTLKNSGKNPFDARFYKEVKNYEDKIIKPISNYELVSRYTSYLLQRGWDELYLHIYFDCTNEYATEFFFLSEIITPWVNYELTEKHYVESQGEPKYLYVIDYGQFKQTALLSFESKEKIIANRKREYYKRYQPELYERLYVLSCSRMPDEYFESEGVKPKTYTSEEIKNTINNFCLHCPDNISCSSCRKNLNSIIELFKD